MDSATLRALQAPLKQAYRDAPESARITSRAEAELDVAAIACRVHTPAGTVVAGLHPAAGGDGSAACSADMLMEALAACTGVTLSAVATAMGIALRGGRIVATCIWDARGTLGVDRAAPVGITDITIEIALDSDAAPESLARLIATAERYCVVYQTLRTPPRLTLVHPSG